MQCSEKILTPPTVCAWQVRWKDLAHPLLTEYRGTFV